MLGSCTAGGAYVPAMSDETVIVRGRARSSSAGRRCEGGATGEVVTAEELGGGEVHARRSGVVDHLAADDDEALAIVRSISDRRAAAPPTLHRHPVEEPVDDADGYLRRRAHRFSRAL